MTIKVFADTADPARIRALASDPLIAGFTTNPTLFRAAGATNYLEHARAVLAAAAGLPVSLEVISDEPEEMARQARILAALGAQVYVKIPVMTTRRDPTHALVARLLTEQIAVNITAVFTPRQVSQITEAILSAPAARAAPIISVFAGRIADAGRDPCEVMADCLEIVRRANARAWLLWASPRQVLDYALADRVGCGIITMTPELIAKLPLLGKDLDDFSRDTVQMFYDDAQKSGFTF